VLIVWIRHYLNCSVKQRHSKNNSVELGNNYSELHNLKSPIISFKGKQIIIVILIIQKIFMLPQDIEL
jgi:hypothetical protein